MSDFDKWYTDKVGIDIDRAKAMGVYDLNLMEAAYKAGYAEAIEASVQHITDQGTSDYPLQLHVYYITDTDIEELRALKEKV